MSKCPRCSNSEISEMDNYCRICGLNLKGEAAAGTAAILEEQLQLLETRKRRVEMRITDPEARQRILAALEARCCSVRSLLQQI
ncbi:hypothetical protein GCM10008933_21260 [Paenibacillus motobuensis]|uniref:Zinc ribbon domain-containing protein n=1 Tax=Paenibacillus motobuensis TaxID=295324 RepID=A0ABN0YBR4_9BACL